MTGEIRGGEVAVSRAAQGLHRCHCLIKQQLTEGWAEKRESKASQKSKSMMLCYYDQVQSWPISPSTRNHKVLFLFYLSSSQEQMGALFLHPCSQTSPLSSLHPLLATRCTVTRQMTQSSAGTQFETHHTGMVFTCRGVWTRIRRTWAGCGKHS